MRWERFYSQFCFYRQNSGFAAAFWFNEISVLFTNIGSTDITIFVSIAWSAAVNASVDTLGDEDAFAFALVDILDDTGTVDVLEGFISDVYDPLATGPDSGSDSFSTSFVVAAGTDNELTLATEIEGFALVVPEPPLTVLLGIGHWHGTPASNVSLMQAYGAECAAPAAGIAST